MHNGAGKGSPTSEEHHVSHEKVCSAMITSHHEQTLPCPSTKPGELEQMLASLGFIGSSV